MNRNLASRRPRSTLLLAIVALTVLVVGCDRSDRPALGTVKGRVTMDGKPWAHAGVVFQPVDGRGRQSMGVTDAEGNYELRYLRDVMGAAVGAHTVRITTQRSNDPATETTPACYNSQTTLTAEIKAGKNENCDFALQSQH